MGAGSVFAAINFAFGMTGWVIVGMIAGFLTHLRMHRGRGTLRSDLLFGLVGAFGGGLLVAFFMNAWIGLATSCVVAFLGALLVIWNVRTAGETDSRV